jgi:hypothetical protein
MNDPPRYRPERANRNRDPYSPKRLYAAPQAIVYSPVLTSSSPHRRYTRNTQITTARRISGTASVSGRRRIGLLAGTVVVIPLRIRLGTKGR